MENKFHKVFNQSECIPEKTLLAYIKKELSPKEKHLVEKHVLHCEMCSDAFEGLSLVKYKDGISKIVSDLNKKILEKKPERQPKIIWMDTRVRVAIAAAVVLLVTSVFVLKNFTAKEADQIFADNMEAYPNKVATDEQTILADSTKIVAQIKETPADGPNQTSAPIPLMDALKAPAKSTIATETREGDMITYKSEQQIIANTKSFESTIAQQKADKVSSGEKSGTGGLLEETKHSQKDLDGADIPMEDAAAKDILNEAEQPARFYDKNMDDRKLADEGKKKTKTDEYRSKSESDKKGKLEKEKEPLAKSQENRSNAEIVTVSGKEKAAKPKAEDKKPETIVSRDEEKGEEKGNVNDNRSNNTQTVAPNSPAGAGSSFGWTTTTLPASGTIVTADISVMDSVSAVSAMKLNDAMKKYDAKDYAGAIPLFEEVLKTEPNNYNALFYSSVSYLSLSSPNADKALVNLEKVLKIQQGQFNDAANWYKGLAYIKKDDKEQARKALRQVKSAEYEKKAKATLDEIK